MTIKEKAERKAAEVTLNQLLKYIDKNPQANLLKLLDVVEKLLGGIFPQKNLDGMRKAIEKGEGVYYDFAMSILNETDRNILKNMLLALGLGAGVHGTKAVRANREKYKCNIPFIILMDPTNACNRRCKGCWSAEYGHKDSLTYDEMASVVSQGKELGTHFYMFTGGEPLIRKDDLIRLCEENPDCGFLAYTNGTLVDEKFCDELIRVGNMTLALSIEGTEETTDDRRGDGSYQGVLSAMKLLKEKGCLFGMSVCYTSANVDQVTSDEFIDKMIAMGVRFGLYFNYMPIGKDAPTNLIPSPDQREHMYKWLRKTRNGQTGKPLFVMDFQDDGEYVGGCIAAGRNYFHINAAGDMEPCVFIHYSDSNIRNKTLLEGLRSPLFMAYRHDQPFNDNHLRPCPMLENPDCLRDIINRTGAKSTNPQGEETAEALCSKCDKFAKAWAPKADELWKNNPHPNPKTQFYRDTPEGKAEFANKDAK
ncbi:MAG: radical SAM protein [Ruminococcus sp.]|nr:radical SAM protein [Ruminococcus sp.]